METDRLEIVEEKLTDKEIVILKEYWQTRGKGFKNKPKQLCEKHNIAMVDLLRMVKTYSYYDISLGICTDCGHEIRVKVRTQGMYIGKRKYSKNICMKCEEELNNRGKAKKNHDPKKWYGLQLKKWEKAVTAFEQILKWERWKDLPEDEFEILKGIVTFENKKLNQPVFNGDAFDKTICKKVENLEKKGFLFVKRNIREEFEKFVFPPQFKYRLWIDTKEIQKSEEVDFLNFTLSRNANNTNLSQPIFSGKHVFERPVRLEANVEYNYAGYMDMEGNVNLKVEPLKNSK